MNFSHMNKSDGQDKTVASVPSFANKARLVFKWLAWIFAIGIAVQVLFAGMALFYNNNFWTMHTKFADYISLLPILMFGASFIAQLPASLRAQSAALIGMIVLIALSAMYSSNIGWVASLHPVIALFLFFRTMAIIRLTNELMKTER